jgi:TRAP-type C4-dicarboxylate transport system substrate-binding protein
MKKMGVFLAGVLFLAFISSPGWSADVIRMRFGHVAPPMHAQHKAAEYFAQYVERESGGRIQCSVHPKGQLGCHIQMLEALQVGTLEVVSVAGPALTEFVPQIALTSLAFMYNTEDEMYALMDSPVGKKIAAAFPSKGLSYGGIADHGFKAFLNRKGPVTKIEDMGKYKRFVSPSGACLKSSAIWPSSPMLRWWHISAPV